jgi:hypothetical protein
MDPFVKWRNDLLLDMQDIKDILQELFDGARKKLHYESNGPVDKNLIRLYQAFKAKEDTDCVLSFSLKSTTRPFVSTKKYDDETYTLKTDQFTVYIYE